VATLKRNGWSLWPGTGGHFAPEWVVTLARNTHPQLIEKEVNFFLDEVQLIDNWEKFARRAVERENIKVFAAGSSSKLTPVEIKTSLRGRQWCIEVSPFSFYEYLIFKEGTLKKDYIYGRNKAKTINYFNEYLKWGGFPEAALLNKEYEKEKLLHEYIEAMFFKDLVEKYDMTNTRLLNTLKDKLFSSFSLKMSLQAFYRQYKSQFPFSKDSLYEYYQNFLKSMLVYEIKKFSESTYKRQRNPAKIYLTDVGLRRKVGSKDSGRVLENLLFLQLRKKYDEIFYFSEKGECDFVAKKRDGLAAFQVCYELHKDNYDREVRGLVEGCKHLNIKKGVLFTYNQEKKLSKKGIEIEVIPSWKWLLEEARKTP